MKEKKKIIYNHVGRPTNEEVNKRKKKKIFKFFIIAIALLFVFGGTFVYINRDKFLLSDIMGNSSTKKIYTFKPNKINSTYYYSSNNTKLVDTLYKKAFGKSTYTTYLRRGYSKYRINIYEKGKFLVQYVPDKIFKVSRKYANKTLTLKLYMINDKNQKVSALLNLKIDARELFANKYSSMVDFAQTFNGKTLNQIKNSNKFSKNNSSNYSSDWCSWFVWNIYYKYGLLSNNTWSKNKGGYGYSYAARWTYEDGYNGYQNNKIIGDVNYIPVPGDIAAIKWNGGANSAANHVGMVIEVGKDYVKLVEGNLRANGVSKVMIITRKLDTSGKYIGGFHVNGGTSGKFVGYYSGSRVAD